MLLADVLTLVSLLSLGGIIGAAGFLRLFRRDRLRGEYIRQNACRWHRWEILEEGPRSSVPSAAREAVGSIRFANVMPRRPLRGIPYCDLLPSFQVFS